MEKIKVMMVDDSVLMRRLVPTALLEDPQIEVTAIAPNGRIALGKMNLDLPDIVILDVEMPEMDGLTTLKEIRKLYPKLPVIMFSSLTTEDAQVTLDALQHGANDYVTKQRGNLSLQDNMKSLGEELIYKIKGLVKSKAPLFSHPIRVEKSRIPPSLQSRIDIVAIGTSTGGPNALKAVLSTIPQTFPVPVVVVQHMPETFTRLLAESLSKNCKIPVFEAKEGDVVVAGKVLIAPGNYHMTIAFRNNQYVIRLNQDPPVNYCRPAVDVLFNSVAQVFAQHTLAVVMTGMGQDGLKGCEDIREKKGAIIVQDEESCVVWGMPGAVATAGLADEMLPLNDIGQAIIQRVNRTRMRS